MVSSMHNTYTHTHLFWRQHNGRVACLHTCGPHHPRCSFASPGTQQCRKNGVNAKLNCPRSVGACPVIPGAARQQLSSVGDRAIVRCPLAYGAGIRCWHKRWHTASAQSSTEALNDSAAQCSQGSSWVSGLLVGVRWRMGAWSRGSPSEAVCVRAYMQAHTHFLVKSRMCNIEAIVQNNCHLHIPTILEWIYDHQPLLKSPDCLSPLAL